MKKGEVPFFPDDFSGRVNSWSDGTRFTMPSRAPTFNLKNGWYSTVSLVEPPAQTSTSPLRVLINPKQELKTRTKHLVALVGTSSRRWENFFPKILVKPFSLVLGKHVRHISHDPGRTRCLCRIPSAARLMRLLTSKEEDPKTGLVDLLAHSCPVFSEYIYSFHVVPTLKCIWNKRKNWPRPANEMR